MNFKIARLDQNPFTNLSFLVIPMQLFYTFTIVELALSIVGWRNFSMLNTLPISAHGFLVICTTIYIYIYIYLESNSIY